MKYQILQTTFALITISALFVGCETTTQHPPQGMHEIATDVAEMEISPAMYQRNLGYALLYNLVTDNARIDGLLTIKRVPDNTAELIREIADTCREIKKQLEQFVKDDPTLKLEPNGLPEVEVDARKRISDTLSGKLLFSSGDRLRILLLMTQSESTAYGQALSNSLVRKDTNQTRQQALRDTAEQFNQLHLQVQNQIFELVSD